MKGKKQKKGGDARREEGNLDKKKRSRAMVMNQYTLITIITIKLRPTPLHRNNIIRNILYRFRGF